jgi:phospholipase C
MTLYSLEKKTKRPEGRTVMGLETNPLKRIEHVVVLMMENHSFDNLLGWLYDPQNEPQPNPGEPYEDV